MEFRIVSLAVGMIEDALLDGSEKNDEFVSALKNALDALRTLRRFF
jgi:hypothetical protein